MERKDRVRIGHLSTVYHTSFILRGSNLLEDQNISAEWSLYPSGPDIVNAMEAGTIDIGYIGLPPVIIGIDRGVPLCCIAGGHIEGTVMIAGSAVKTLAECSGMAEFLIQFSGSAIGCPPRGSIHDVIVNKLLQEYGIPGVAVRNYPWADFLPDALLNGEIAAAAGTPALAVAGMRFAGARIAINPDLLWPFNPSYGIVVMRDALLHKDLLTRFLIAHEAASEMIRYNPRTCARIVAKVTGMVEEDFVMETYAISPKYCAALPEEYIDSTLKFSETLFSLGYTSHAIDKREIFDTTLIDSVHTAPHHYRSGIG